MKLEIIYHPSNLFPLKGILVRGSSVTTWLKEIMYMNLSLREISVYPVAGNKADTIWGCLIIPGRMDIGNIGRNSFCQMVAGTLFIPERANIFPPLPDAELSRICNNRKYFYHPETGIHELTEPVRWEKLILTKESDSDIRTPASTVFIPGTIRSYQIIPISPEDNLRDLENKAVPETKEFDDRPLTLLEKGKLGIYRALWDKKADDGAYEKTRLLSGIEAVLPVNGMVDRMQQDMESLEQRNQKELDKLLDLLNKDPEEALKYAIPLDENNSTRGGDQGQFTLSRRWSAFSIFNNSQSGKTSGTVNLGDGYQQLYNQYRKTAQELIDRKDYLKAAFVYIKLLKDYYSAATTLQAGKLFQEAASVYLKHLNNRLKAAECYEKGNMFNEAIQIYKELDGYNEKVGDLYIKAGNRKDAMFYYNQVVSDYQTSGQFVKAALLLKEKMDDLQRGQSMLLEGWHTNKDSFNCLNNYLANIHDPQIIDATLHSLYHDTNDLNRETFLRILKHEYSRNEELQPSVRDMAYEIISMQSAANKSIVSELVYFNQKDTQLLKDTIRYKLNKNE